MLGQLGFDSKYTIGEQLGCSGAQTTAFKLKEDSTDKDFVLRIPNNPDNMERWLLSEKGLDDKQDKYLSDYRGIFVYQEQLNLVRFILYKKWQLVMFLILIFMIDCHVKHN